MHHTTRSWALNRVHNSHWPLNRLQYAFALGDPVTLTFDQIFNGGRGFVIDYPSGKYGDSSFSPFGLSCGQTATHRDAANCFTPATVVSVSNNYSVNCN